MWNKTDVTLTLFLQSAFKTLNPPCQNIGKLLKLQYFSVKTL
jgi:hypothetical protein